MTIFLSEGIFNTNFPKLSVEVPPFLKVIFTEFIGFPNVSFIVPLTVAVCP